MKVLFVCNVTETQLLVNRCHFYSDSSCVRFTMDKASGRIKGNNGRAVIRPLRRKERRSVFVYAIDAVRGS